MKSLPKRIQAWRSRRQGRWLQRWEQTRAEGKRPFVFRTALTYGISVLGVTDVLNNMFYGGIQPSISLINLIVFVVSGVLIGSNAWSNREDKYLNALHEARIKALPNSKNFPASRA